MRRTTATTEYLKECMGTALLELMREKPLEKISIEEMTARADVGRSTYSDEAAAARMFFEFCLSMREVSDLLYATGHQGCILDAYLQILRPDADGENALEYYRSNMTAYALYGLVNAWILRGYRETPAEMERIVLDWMDRPEKQEP